MLFGLEILQHLHNFKQDVQRLHYLARTTYSVLMHLIRGSILVFSRSMTFFGELTRIMVKHAF